MPTGIVTTSMGVALNMDELIDSGSRAIGPMDKSTKEHANYQPEVSKPHIRGFIPTPTGTPTPVTETTTKDQPDKVVQTQSVSEMTAVVVKKTTAPKSKKPIAKDNTKVADEDAVLGNLLGKLDSK